jgi:hypothetical protein
MRQEAFSRNFWLFWIWQPGLKYCKQQHSVACNRSWVSPGDSVVFCMSDDLDGQIRAAETGYKTAVGVVENGIQNAEDSYVGIHGVLETFGEYLDCFTEFRARVMDTRSKLYRLL